MRPHILEDSSHQIEGQPPRTKGVDRWVVVHIHQSTVLFHWHLNYHGFNQLTALQKGGISDLFGLSPLLLGLVGIPGSKGPGASRSVIARYLLMVAKWLPVEGKVVEIP